MPRLTLIVVSLLCAADAAADPPPPARAAGRDEQPAPPAPSSTPAPRRSGVTTRVDLAVTPPPIRVTAAAPRFDWAPAPQPSFGMFTASADVGGGPMTSPDGTPVSAGGWELGLSGGWGPTRFAELRLRASFFDQPDRERDANGDQQDDVDERNLVGMFLGGGLRLRLPLYTGVGERSAARFLLFSEGLVGYQSLFSYGDVVSSGPAFEVTNGLQISHVRRRDGLTRGVELFVRYRQGLGAGNEDLNAVLFGVGYATEWSAYVPPIPPPPAPRVYSGAVLQTIRHVPAPTLAVDASAEASARGNANGAEIEADAHGGAGAGVEWETPADPGRPLGFSLRMGGECGGGDGWHVAKTVGWAPWRLLELQLKTSYFSIDHSLAQSSVDEPNVQGLFAGVGPRLHLVADNGLRLGLWASATLGWAQVVSAPPGRDGSGLAANVAVGVSFGVSSHPFSTGDLSFYVARQFGLTADDDDVGMLHAGLAFDYELGPHRPPPPDPVRPPSVEPVRPSAPPAPPAPSEPAPSPVVRTRTEVTVEPLRPARPWPVGFAIGGEIGIAYFPRRLGARFEDSGLDLGLGVGFVASPYFEIRSRVGLLTRSDAAETGGDDIEAVTIAAGPRVRIPIRTLKDGQIALILEALGGWLTTADPAGTSLGSSALIEGGIGVRFPAQAGLTAGVRGTWALGERTRELTSVQVTLGAELEMGPRFRRPVVLPEIPRVEVPERVDVEVQAGASAP